MNLAFPLLFLHTVSNQKLDSGKPWEKASYMFLSKSLGYRSYSYESLYRKPEIYNCGGMQTFIDSCVEKMESMPPQQIASTLLAFLQR